MKKSVITLLIFLIMIISVSAVSAADDASDLGATDGDALSISNTDVAIADGVKNFTDLSADIAGGTSGDKDLGSNYVRNDTNEAPVTISVNKTINGQGFTIDANGTGKIFIIDAGTKVTLKNVTLKNAAENAIVNNGKLTLEDVTFINCSAYSIDSAANSILTVTNCNFEDYGINFAGTTLSLSGNTFNNASAPLATITAGTLASTSTVTVVANCNPWNTINVVATVKDDKGNLININTANSWTLTIGDEPYTVTPTNGILNYTANAKKYGSQKVTATNKALTNPTIVDTTVTVKPNAQTTSEIKYDFSNTSAIAYGDDFNVTVYINNLVKLEGVDYNATGTFTIFVNNNEWDTVGINATTGKATFEFKDIARNNYAFTIKYNGDDVYPVAQVEVPAFTVGAATATPVLNVTLAENGAQTVDIIFPVDAWGTVEGNITLSGTEVYTIDNGALVDGKRSISLNLPASDDYMLNIYFASTTSDYVSHTYNLPLVIGKLNTTVDISVENTTYGNNVTIEFTLAKGVYNATYTIVNSSNVQVDQKTVNLTNGTYKLVLDVPAADEYTITVASADNNKYNVNSTTTKFKVAKATSAVTMVIGDHTLGKEVQANVTVKFGNKNGTGKVGLVVNGHVVTAKDLDANGTATLTIDKDYIVAGVNTISAVFTSNNVNYTSETITDSFTVAQLTPTINVTVGDVNITKDAILTIKVSGDAGTPTGFVTVKLGDKTYSTAVLNNGEVDVTIPAADINEVKQYSVDVSYDPNGNDNYTAKSTVFKFEVTYWYYEITIGDIENKTVGNNITFNVNAKGDKAFAQNFTVDIKDANGAIVKTTSVKLNNVATNVPVEFSLPRGVYTAVVSYAGDGNYSANSTTSKAFSVAGIIENLTIEVENATYPKNATVTVKASVDGLYNVTVEGKSYNVTVTGGIGSVDLDVLAAKDSYDATVASMMADYNKTTNSTKFTIKKGTVQGATLTMDTVTYPENVTAIVSAPVDGNYTIVSESGLANPGIVEVINGTGKINFTVPAGKFTFTLWTPADNTNYTSVEADTKQVTVNKGTVDVNLTIEDVFYNAAPNVFINASVGGDYSIKVINSTGAVVNSTTVTLVAGVAQTLPVNAKVLTPGTYTVNVTATVANYSDVELSKTFEVKTGIVYYNITATEITYDGTTKVKFTVNTNVKAINATQQLGYEVFLGDKNITFTNGNEEITIDTILAAGTYTLKVVPKAGDDAFKYYNFGSEYNTTDVKVNPATASFDVTVTESVQYPNNVTITIKNSNFTGNYTVKVGNIIKEVNVTANTDASVNITDLPVGGYIAYVTSNNANYTVVTKTVTFSVNYGPIKPTVANVEAYYHSPAVVTVVSSAEGAYIVTVNNKPYTVNVKDGKGNVTIDDVLAVGTYDIKLTADIPDYVPYSNDTIAKLTVKQAGVGLSINVTEVTYPEKATATVFANVTGTYTVTVYNNTDNSKVAEYDVNITTDAGNMASATVDLGVLRPAYGTYKATVSAKKYDDVNFTATSNETAIVVNKATPVIIISVLDSYGVYNEIVINVTVANADAPDQVTIKCDLLGDDWVTPKDLTNGFANFTIPKDKVNVFGTHMVYANVTGGDFVAGVINKTTFEVTKINTGFNITFNNATYLEDAIINVTLTNLAEGVNPTGTIVIPGFGSLTVDSNKNYTFTLGKLAAGEHTIDISYSGDGVYNGNDESYTFTIAKLKPVVTVTAVTGGTYPDNATVTFTSTAAGDFIITVIDADGNVAKTIEGINATANTDKKVVIEGLSGGKYTANVTYVESANYSSVTNTSAVFEIAKATTTIKATAIPAAYPNAVVVVVNAGQAGKYIINVFKGTENVYNTTGALVAGDNSVTLAVLPVGDYNFVVDYDSTDYAADSVSGQFTIVKGVPNIEIVGNNATYPAAASATITSNADGAYTVIMGTIPVASGNFTAGVPVVVDLGVISAGAHDIAVSFAGNDNCNPTTVVGTITVNKGTPVITITVDTQTIDQNATLTITIPGATGDYVTVEGHQVPLVGGVATYNIGVLKAQTYEFTAVYDGDTNLTYAYNNITFTVANYKLSGNDVTVIYSASATYKVLVTLDGVPAAGKTVSIRFNGVTYNVDTDANGYAALKLKTSIAPKTYTITATFNGVKISNKVKINHVVVAADKTVKKSTKVTKVKITLRKVNGKYLAKKTIKVKFRGKTYNVKTDAKGIAYWKVTKAMVSSLKVGSKYGYKATYGKDTVSKKLLLKNRDF